MKLFYIILFAVIISTPSYATWVRSYVKKDGTFVSGHYRRPRGYGRSLNTYYPASTSYLNRKYHCPENSVITTNEHIIGNKPSFSPANEHRYTIPSWLGIYKKAAVFNSDTSHINKAEYLYKFKELNILKQIIKQSIPLCHDEKCIATKIKEQPYWNIINKKIDNVYFNLNLRKPIYSLID